MNLADDTQLKLKNPVSAAFLSEAVKEIQVPSMRDKDGANLVPASVVAICDPTVNPIPLVPQGTPLGRGTLVQTSTVYAVTAGLTVPRGKVWQLIGWVSDYTTTATVGNRVILGLMKNGAGSTTWIGAASAAVVASKVCGYDFSFGSISGPNTTVRRNLANTANTDIQVTTQSPVTLLQAGGSIVLFDATAVDAADTYRVVLTYVEYDV